MSGRYRLICVAPEMGDLMSTDNLDEAALPNLSEYHEHID